MQASQSSKSWSSHLDHRCARSLRSGGPSQSPPAPYRPCSIPIIPSVHSYQDEVSCMQTAPTAGSSRSSPLESTAEASAVDQQSNVTVSNRAAGRREEVASLLDEAQEQLRALAHAQRKQEDISSSVPQGAKETVLHPFSKWLWTRGSGLFWAHGDSVSEPQRHTQRCHKAWPMRRGWLD